MSLTQNLNAKANVKKGTGNDLPFSPQQPVIASFTGVSTLNQTVINLGFSIQAAVNGSTTAFTDIFFLFIDGKYMTVSADFTFTAVATDGTSSQITMNAAIPAAGLNIRAFKLGLKSEIQFGMDNRFVQLYAAQGAGFQPFVSQTDAVSAASTTAGAPIAGTFYSSIIGRSSMVDLSQDLKPRLGIERLMTQYIYQILSEAGPNSDPIWGSTGDIFNQIRFVGQWSNFLSIAGQGIASSASLTDYMEVTFYGTGLNLLTNVDIANRDIRVSVDGGSEGSNITLSGSGVLAARNYSVNAPIVAISGLSLGVHTVKLRNNNAAGIGMFGFEIVNQVSAGSNLVSVTPGVAYSQGQKLVLASQSTLAYNAALVGTTGGRVLEYISSSGVRSQAFTQNATSPSYLTAASHANEELVKSYFFREFSASRGDDFLNNSTTAKAFTLDDGTTTLSSIQGVASVFNGRDAMNTGGSPAAIMFTFVGTGLDIVRSDVVNGGSDTYAFYIDGVSIFNAAAAGSTIWRTQKIASGLPYGTHTFEIRKISASTYDIAVAQFIVYQPKKPALPSGAIEIGDFNIMANYSPNTTAGAEFISGGVLRKASTRELTYVGSWSATIEVGTGTTNAAVAGWIINGSTSGNYVQYTFFGTGVELRFGIPGTTAGNYTVSIDGSSNLTGLGATTSFYGGVTSFSATTGVVVTNTANNYGSGVSITGLTLGLHTVKFAYNSGSAMPIEAFDIITPVHSVKANLYGDLEAASSIGSCAISDNRKFTPIKDPVPTTKAWAQAIGITVNPSTSSTSPIPMPDMSAVVKTNGGPLRLSFSAQVENTGLNQIFWQFYVDGLPVGVLKNIRAPQSAYGCLISDVLKIPASAGTHKVDVFWYVGAGTVTADSTSRTLVVEET
jgi:hypothetical protein